MNFLYTKNLILSVIPKGYPIGDIKELEIKINDTNRLYRGILPKKLQIHGYKKYNLDERLIKYINESNILNVDFNDFDGLMYLNISNLEFDDGKKYSGKITIEMKRYFNIDGDIDVIQDIDILRKQLKTSIDYIKILENKISKLEEIKNNQFDNYSYYSD